MSRITNTLDLTGYTTPKYLKQNCTFQEIITLQQFSVIAWFPKPAPVPPPQKPPRLLSPYWGSVPPNHYKLFKNPAVNCTIIYFSFLFSQVMNFLVILKRFLLKTEEQIAQFFKILSNILCLTGISRISKLNLFKS